MINLVAKYGSFHTKNERQGIYFSCLRPGLPGTFALAAEILKLTFLHWIFRSNMVDKIQTAVTAKISTGSIRTRLKLLKPIRFRQALLGQYSGCEIRKWVRRAKSRQDPTLVDMQVKTAHLTSVFLSQTISSTTLFPRFARKKWISVRSCWIFRGKFVKTCDKSGWELYVIHHFPWWLLFSMESYSFIGVCRSPWDGLAESYR